MTGVVEEVVEVTGVPERPLTSPISSEVPRAGGLSVGGCGADGSHLCDRRLTWKWFESESFSLSLKELMDKNLCTVTG